MGIQTPHPKRVEGDLRMNETIEAIKTAMEKDEHLRLEVLAQYYANEADYVKRNGGKATDLDTFLYGHGDALDILQPFYTTK